MAHYRYKAKDTSGKLVVDSIEADTLKGAVAKLHSLHLHPFSITPYTETASWKKILEFRFHEISRSDMILFTCRLSDLLRGGLMLVRALEVLERQTENIALKKIIGDIRTRVHGGEKFSHALQMYPQLFSEMYIGMVQAGEASGLLESVLSRLAEFGEKEENLRHTITSVLVYPCVMLVVGIASVIFLLAFVIPKFEVMFIDMGQTLPLPTRILIGMSEIVKQGWWIYIPVLIAGSIGVNMYLKKDTGKIFVHRLLLQLPVVGMLIKKRQIARFVMMLSALLKNGVPILDALALVKRSIGNMMFKTEMDTIYERVREGEHLVEPIRRSILFPPIVADMVAIGEETGNLEGALERVSEIYIREVDYAMKSLTSLIEPMIILIVGLMVAFVAVSMLLPIFQVSAGIR